MITSLSKPMLSVALIVAIFFSIYDHTHRIALAFFMLGALYMHYRIRDELIKYIALGTIFACCVAIVIVS